MFARGLEGRIFFDDGSRDGLDVDICPDCIAKIAIMFPNLEQAIRCTNSCSEVEYAIGLLRKGQALRCVRRPIGWSETRTTGEGMTMADSTKIEWTDATWNPITGCSVVSPGCTNCYAMRLAGTRMKHHESRIGLTDVSKTGPVWNGQVRFNEQWLDQPLRWKKPRMIFVCAHGDLFHENIPDEWIDQVFAVMALCPQHVFQVLTKRADRMREYLSDPEIGQQWWLRADDLACTLDLPETHHGMPYLSRGAAVAPSVMPNVWLGVSAEDQQRADERIPLLLQTPAAVRWVSAEPLLGPINFRWQPYAHQATGESYRAYLHREGSVDQYESLKGISWIVAGGESGPGSRPAHPAWFRSLRDQCAAAGVPYFFKQWGDWTAEIDNADLMSPQQADPDDYFQAHSWPLDHGQYESQRAISYRVGKKRAGNMLDGRQHQEWPDG